MSHLPDKIQPDENKAQLFVLTTAMASQSLRPYILKHARPEWFTGIDAPIFQALQEALKSGRYDHLKLLEYLGEAGQKRIMQGRSELPIIPKDVSIIDGWFKTLADSHMLRRAQVVFSEGQAEAFSGTNPHRLIGEAITKLADLTKDRRDNPMRDMTAVSIETHSLLAAWKSGDIYAGRLATRFGVLDRKIGGLLKKKLTILAARPGMGKTTVATAIIANVAREILRTERKAKVVFFSAEMEAWEIHLLIASAISGISSEWYRTGEVTRGKQSRPITDAERGKFESAVKEVEKLPIVIDDSRPLTTSDMMNRCLTLEAENPDGIDLIVMDYGGLLSDPQEKGQRKDEWCGMITQRCLEIAARFDCPFLMLWQLNREADDRNDRMPELTDLRDSGNLEQDAHTVLFLMRPAYYGQYNEDTRQWIYQTAAIRSYAEQFQNEQGMIVNVAKNRGAAVGIAKMYMDGATKTVYEEIVDRPMVL